MGLVVRTNIRQVVLKAITVDGCPRRDYRGKGRMRQNLEEVQVVGVFYM